MSKISSTKKGTNQVSLARALSKFGLTSRSRAALFIKSGAVSVNRRVIRNPNARVDLHTVRISVEGTQLGRRRFFYLALHKPTGVVTTRSDELGRKTVYDLLPASTPWVFPIGRLDKDTSGLLILTNDTRLGERLLPAMVRSHPSDSATIELTILEGKNRQIRRMCEQLGYTVRALKRMGIGPITLGDLKEGEVRLLSREDVASFVQSFQTPKYDKNRLHDR